MNKTNKGTRKGFTLLEILLVIALIGILAAIALVAINPNRQIAQARNLQRKSDIDAIYNALEMYTIRNRGTIYPGINFTPKEICNTGSEQVDGAANCNGKVDLSSLVPTYITSIPTDPQGLGYQISRNSDNNSISITAPSSELGQTIAINPPPPPKFSVTSCTYANQKITIPYTEGEVGYNYNSHTINSTDITGLTATLASGTLSDSGTLEYAVTGNPSGAGSANFNLSNIGNMLISCNNSNIAVTEFCPTNYIAVPGNSLYQTDNFCVMKYETKATTPAAITQAAGTPVVNITQTSAISACNANNTGGSTGYGLINNREWMTIARNIEAQPSNWTGGAVGSGGLWRGHSDNNPPNALAASTDDNPYFGTNNTSPSIERRTHSLSNGETIWDLSGNVWEWTNDTIMGNQKPNNSSGSFWQQWTAISNFGTLSYDLTRPSNNTWNSTQNMGQYYAGGLTGGPFAFIRGGGWNDATNAGVFALYLFITPSGSNFNIGFRCVLR